MNPQFIYSTAILSNGLGIEMESGREHLLVGDLVQTQWGDRQVVAIKRGSISLEADPEYCYVSGCPSA